ncbi:MAG TPA: hypothetical protein VNX47_03210 [Nevskia sp.]|nr:hypothetical protein [Nevskia sp.]
MRNLKRMAAGIVLFPLLAFAALPKTALAQDSELERQVDAATGTVARPASTGLPGTVVSGRKNPLHGSDRRLSILIMSLPSGGERAQNRADIVGWFQNQVALRRNPNQASGEELQMMQRASAPPVGSDPDAGADALP